ncbi:MAG: sulfotransferase [Actinomycetota bacterium]|nr:sulfotransferase [Actinomycetota bacterium]
MSRSDEQALASGGGRAAAVAGRLPNFFVIGAMKAGTSSLYRYLSAHPEVFLPAETKEPAFFARNWRLGVNWYRSLFEEAGEAVAVGEASTSYSKFPTVTTVPERMAGLVPEARLIYLLRDPIERMKSHYVWLTVHGTETRPIDVALLEEPAYVAVSRYALQIKRFLPYYGLDRFLLITSEALRAQREATLRRVFEFLGVDPAFRVPDMEREFNRTGGRRSGGAIMRAARRLPMARRLSVEAPPALRRVAAHVLTREEPAPDTTLRPETDQELRERLSGDVRRLREYMGPGFDGWGIA